MAEKEYIERNAVVNGLRAAIKKYSDDKSEANIITALIFQRFAKEIEAIPAADVEPVRHGRWIYNPNGMDFNLGAWECSVCTQKNNNLPCNRNISPYICVGSKYCPNCGARMDGDTDANGNDNKTPET